MIDAISAIGGVAGFYGSVIIAIFSAFTEIDYLTEIIKRLFLEKQTNRKFFE